MITCIDKNGEYHVKDVLEAGDTPCPPRPSEQHKWNDKEWVIDEAKIIAQGITEASAYLRDTDWVETYKLRHDLKLELIPETSSKWEVLAKRDECKTFIRDNS